MFFTPTPKYKIKHWGEVRQQTIAELGVDVKYGYPTHMWDDIERGEVLVFSESYPYMDAVVSDEDGYMTLEQMYNATPAYHINKDKFPAPLSVLRHLTK
jgi:hypothetical protein